MGVTGRFAKIDRRSDVELQQLAYTRNSGSGTWHQAYLQRLSGVQDENAHIVAYDRVLHERCRGPQKTQRRMHVALQQGESLDVGGASQPELIQHDADARFAFVQLLLQNRALSSNGGGAKFV